MGETESYCSLIFFFFRQKAQTTTQKAAEVSRKDKRKTNVCMIDLSRLVWPIPFLMSLFTALKGSQFFSSPEPLGSQGELIGWP